MLSVVIALGIVNIGMYDLVPMVIGVENVGIEDLVVAKMQSSRKRC